MKIGIFDSGIGGLTVLKEAIKELPHEDFIYFADTAHAPYGTQTEKMVQGYIDEVVDFLHHKGIDALVIACNTATSIAAKELRERYDFPVIGMEPAVKVGLDSDPEKRVLVFATPLALKGHKYKELLERLDMEHRVDSHALPGLVRLAEDHVFEKEIIEDFLRQELISYDLRKYCAIVLGCTHYVYYKDIIGDYVGDSISIVDGNEGTIRYLKKVIGEYVKTEEYFGSVEYFHSTENGIDKTDYETLTQGINR